MGSCFASDIVASREKQQHQQLQHVFHSIDAEHVSEEEEEELETCLLLFQSFSQILKHTRWVDWENKSICDAQMHKRREKNAYTPSKNEISRDDVGRFVRFFFLMHCFNTLYLKAEGKMVSEVFFYSSESHLGFKFFFPSAQQTHTKNCFLHIRNFSV